MKKIVCWLVAASLALLSCTEGEGNAALGIIPMPNEMETAIIPCREKPRCRSLRGKTHRKWSATWQTS